MVQAKTWIAAGLVTFASFLGSVSHAETMTCIVSVYTAQDVLDIEAGKEDSNKTSKLIDLPIVDGGVDHEFQVNGETIAMTLWKYQYTDMYEMIAMLKTPVADLPAHGLKRVAMINERLYNDGPARGTADPKTPGTRFAYLENQGGSFALATKLVAALKAEGQWGKYPYDTNQMDLQNSAGLTEFIVDQVKAKKLNPSDVIGMSTMLSCTYSK